jgi:hypothetical protein
MRNLIWMVIMYTVRINSSLYHKIIRKLLKQIWIKQYKIFIPFLAFINMIRNQQNVVLKSSKSRKRFKLFVFYSKHSGHTFKTRWLLSHTSSSLNRGKYFIVILKSYFAVTCAKFPTHSTNTILGFIKTNSA